VSTVTQTWEEGNTKKAYGSAGNRDAPTVTTFLKVLDVWLNRADGFLPWERFSNKTVLTKQSRSIIIYIIIIIKIGDIMRISNYLSATNLAKHTSSALNSFETGDNDKFIILKNNEPKAVLLSIESYEAMEEEIEDLRLAALALSRIQSFDPRESITHDEMMKKFAK